MRTLCLIAVSCLPLIAACDEQGELVPSPTDHAWLKAQAQQADGDYAPADAEPVEGDEGVEACYPDSNGGTWTFEADSIGDDHGTYTRRDENGDVTSTGTWSQDQAGDIEYESDGGGSGSMTNTREGYDYSGTTDDGQRESGSLDASGSC